ncbi:hypothetical protein Tco_0884067 [Tanacetum coccineum]
MTMSTHHKVNHRSSGQCWNDLRDLAKPVKAISMPQDVPSAFDRRMLELEDQIKYLMKKPKANSTHVPQAYANVVSPVPQSKTFNQPSRKTPFSFQQSYPEPQRRELEPSFETCMQEYMASHTERVERFKKSMFKQRDEINGRMARMFRLLKELTSSTKPEKVLIREEVRNPITKNINAIGRIKKKEVKENNDLIDKDTINHSEKNNEAAKTPIRTITKEPLEEERKLIEPPELLP